MTPTPEQIALYRIWHTLYGQMLRSDVIAPDWVANLEQIARTALGDAFDRVHEYVNALEAKDTP